MFQQIIIALLTVISSPSDKEAKETSSLGAELEAQVQRYYPLVRDTGKIPRICIKGYCASCKWNEVSFKCKLKAPGTTCDSGCNGVECWHNCT